jgi:phosphoglycolate phosphatase-like HAD superfamily hydrolase
VRELLDALTRRDDVAVGARHRETSARAPHQARARRHPPSFPLRRLTAAITSSARRSSGSPAERGAARLGRPLDACRVVVIGDTPRDVEAARAVGAETLAVETGGIPSDVLRAAGATWVVPDLTATGVFDLLVSGA